MDDESFVFEAAHHADALEYWRGNAPAGCYYDDVLADMAIDFVEGFCVQSKGKWAGQAVQLLPWQRRIVAILWGWRREDGTRQFRTCYVEVPRKNGKSTLCSALALLLLFADGEPGAEAYAAAGSKDQARIVFAEAKNMLQASPALERRAKVYKDVIAAPATRSKFVVLAADAEVQHGLNASGIIFDELHVQPNRDLYDVLRTSTGARRQPLMISITTAGYDRESVCWEQHERSRSTMADPHIDPTHLGVIYAAEEGDDWKDPAVWAKANPSLGETLSVEYLEEMCKEASLVPALQNTFLRLHLNIWTNQETHWLDMAQWDACLETDEVDLRGRKCFGALDLASTTDTASLVLAFPPETEGEPIRLRLFVWIPEEGLVERVRRDRVPYDLWKQRGLLKATPGNVIDYDVILADIVGRYQGTELVEEGLAQRYQIEEMAYDPWRVEMLATRLELAGLTTVAMRQGVPTMGGPTAEFGRLVANGGIGHDGDPVLRWMADNVMVVVDDKGNMLPSKKRSRQKIDGIVASIMALGRALLGGEEDSVYEQRGIIEFDE